MLHQKSTSDTLYLFNKDVNKVKFDLLEVSDSALGVQPVRYSVRVG